MAALLPVFSCEQQDLSVDLPVNESIILDLSSRLTKVADTDTESYVDKIDVFIFEASAGLPDALAAYENFTVNNDSQVVLQSKRSDFPQGEEYFVYVVANSTLDFSGIGSFKELNDLRQVDPLLHLTGLDVPDAPRHFLMDGVAKDENGASPVVLNNGVPADNTELDVILSRAAAKVVITITASDNITFRNYGIEHGSEGGLFYVRNQPYDTWVLAETQNAQDLQNVLLRTTAKTDTEYFTWNPEHALGAKEVTLVTYVYPHNWNNESILDKETCAIINLPMDYKVSDSETVPYHNSWYKIPMTDNETFERNHIYQVRINLDRPGASDESEPINLEEIFYSVEDWTEVTVSVGSGDRPQFLQLNTDHVDMYNVNIDDKTLKFASSSEVSVSLIDAYYINKFGQVVNVDPGIYATPDAGLNGSIEIFSPFVKEPGVVDDDSHGNVIRYMTFRVNNQDGDEVYFTVNQYPVIYITHELGHYSYRSDFGGTNYIAMGDPNYSGATWNNSSKTWTYTGTASGSNFFGSKVANSYKIVDGKPVKQEPSRSGTYSLYYAYWKRQSNRYVLDQDDPVSVFNNPRMYHVHVTATSENYTVARPRLDNEGFTEASMENTMLVSPSFMIASQLGGTDLGGGGSTVSVDKAKRHCEQYVEVTYDENGNTIAYDDWRLPTAAEIDIIINHQYNSQAMVEVMNGGNYYCALNPKGSGNSQYLKKIPNNTLTSNHVRCIRDAY